MDKQPLERTQETTPTRPVADPPPQPKRREDTGERRRDTDR